MRLRKRLERTGLSASRSMGLFELAARSRTRRNSLLILCYHGLSLCDEHEWLDHLFIRPEQFRQRLACLRDAKASVLPLAEALIRLEAGTLPPRSVALTFDDGFYDFLVHGIPILSEFGFPCTLYLTTHYCRYRLPIINLILDYLLWKAGPQPVVLPEQGIEAPMRSATYEERQQIVKRVLDWMARERLNTEGKDQVASEIASRLGIDYGVLREKRMVQILSCEEAHKVARAGVDIQLHTHRHRTPRDRNLFVREIRDNANFIRELTGKIPEHFCYPSGDYALEFIPWLEECGVKSGTTCERGLAHRDSEPMLLPRVLDDSVMDSLRFESFVYGLFA